MVFSTGEVVPVSGSDQPFKVIFKTHGEVVGEWPVSSRAEGENQIIELLRRLQQIAKDEGYL